MGYGINFSIIAAIPGPDFNVLPGISANSINAIILIESSYKMHFPHNDTISMRNEGNPGMPGVTGVQDTVPPHQCG